ncbi:hypothetical protein HDU67_010427 [Dinochytrium kinnereticum]|nr:hypothetical protein HDU67_010427 [Dinochytrium kinnereticum]
MAITVHSQVPTAAPIAAPLPIVPTKVAQPLVLVSGEAVPVISPLPVIPTPVVMASDGSGRQCTAVSSMDRVCGRMAPALSTFGVGEGMRINATYFPMLAMMCPAVKAFAETFSVMLCLGAMGPCNDATFTLPETDDQGIPKNFTAVSVFYNTAKFSQLIPSLRSQNILIPCYSACSNVAKAITSCSALTSLGVDPNADPCAGLPQEGCLDTTGTIEEGGGVVGIFGGGVAVAAGGTGSGQLAAAPPAGQGALGGITVKGSSRGDEAGRLWIFAGFAIAAYIFL